jgi:hypothetical protein
MQSLAAGVATCFGIRTLLEEWFAAHLALDGLVRDLAAFAELG